MNPPTPEPTKSAEDLKPVTQEGKEFHVVWHQLAAAEILDELDSDVEAYTDDMAEIILRHYNAAMVHKFRLALVTEEFVRATDFDAARKEAHERERVLREALEAITRRVPFMGSCGDYREGQIHALDACSEVAKEALNKKEK